MYIYVNKRDREDDKVSRKREEGRERIDKREIRKEMENYPAY